MNYAEKIREKLAAMESIINKAKSENRALTDAEKSLTDDLRKEIDGLKASAEAEAKFKAEKDALRQSVSVAGVHGSDPPAAESTKFGSFGEFLMCVKNAKMGIKYDNRLYPLSSEIQNSTGMNVTVGSDGGFLVDQEFVKLLKGSMMEYSALLPRITMIPTGAGYSGIRLPAIDETSRANGSRWGGINTGWATEGVTQTAGKMKVRKIDLPLEKLMSFVYVTDELLMDAIALETYVKMAVADDMAFMINDAIINGDGNGKPLGILKSPALIQVAKESGQTGDTILYDNVINMWSRMPVRSRATAVWLLTLNAEPQLAKMSLAVGTGGVPVYLPAGGAADQPFATLFGRPVIPCEQCPELGDLGDIVFADLSTYIGTDKGGMQSDVSMHVSFLTDEQVFRFIYRFNGTTYYKSAVASKAKAAHTLSPYVALAERA